MTEPSYTIEPNRHGEMSLWRINTGGYGFPVELFSKHNLDRVDPVIWRVLVECLVGGLADDARGEQECLLPVCVCDVPVVHRHWGQAVRFRPANHEVAK